MAVAKRQYKLVALHGRTVTNAVDFQLAGEPGRNTDDHVTQIGPHGAPQRPCLTRIACQFQRRDIVGERQLDITMKWRAELAVLSLHDHHSAIM